MYKILENAPPNIQNHLIKESFRKGDFLLMQGDTNEYLYFILKGRVNVDTVSKQGIKISITSFSAGQSIGVLEVFNTDIHAQNVEVMEDTEVIKLHKNYVLEWMKADFNFTLYIVKLLEECFHDTSTFVRNLLSMTIRERTIVSLYKHYKNNTLSTLTKQKLQQETGTQKRSLNRVVEKLIDEGVINFEKRFTITNSDKLYELAVDLL